MAADAFNFGGLDPVPQTAVGYPIRPSRPPIPLSVLVCLSTCPDSEVADRIAAALVEARLAACVNAMPGVRSTYRWKGGIQRDDETLLIIKTTKDRLERLVDRLAELHPYELPEVIAVEAAGGLPAYLDWIAAQTREEDR